MTHYINLEKKRLCGRNNNTVPPLMVDYSTIETLEFQFINSNNQIQPLDAGLSGFYMAGSLKMCDPSCELLFLSKDFTIEDGKLKFSVDTYTQPYLRKITKKNTEINLEIGQIALDTKKVWLRDYALANPRVYVAGLSPQEIESNDFYTKTEVNELVDAAEAYADEQAAAALNDAKAYADGQDAAILASANAYTDEQIEHLEISGYVTDEEFEAAKTELDGKIALKASEADLQIVSGAVDTNTASISTIQTDLASKASEADLQIVSGAVDTNAEDIQALEQDITGKADKADVDIISGTVDGHIADTTIHTTAAEKAAWDAKAEVSDIPTDNAQLTNGAGYQTAQDVQSAISGKAETSYVDSELAKKQDKITADNKLGYDLLSGTPDLSVYALDSDLQVVSGAVDTKLEAPSGGTAGQVLMKTETGSEWVDTQVDIEPDYLTLTADEAGATIALNKSEDTPSLSAVLEYSTDGKTWTNYTWDGTSGLVITLANVGDFAKFRGDNERFSIYTSSYYKFKLTGRIAGSGVVDSLLSKNVKDAKLSNCCYYKLFQDCSSLTSAPELPATTLADSCYNLMFQYCSSLTSAPALPATTLAYYCYASMFAGCTSLTSAPELPATTLAKNCYFLMFFNCNKLTTAPALPATTLANGCYQQMFQGCFGISRIEVPFDTWSSSTTDNWLQNVAASGTFYCPYGLDTSIRDISHIPIGWDVVYTDVPESVLSGATAAAEALTMING